MCPLHPGTKLGAPTTAGPVLMGSGLGRALSGVQCVTWREGLARGLLTVPTISAQW